MVQLPVAGEPGGRRRRERLLAARQRRQGPRDRQRVDVRRAGRQHHRRRSPDRVVLGLRRRPRLVHGHGPHGGVVRHRRGQHPPAHPRRPPDRDRRRAVRLRRAAPGRADGRRLRDRHDRRRHREPDGARRRRRRPRLLRRAHHRRDQRLQPGQRPGDDGDPDPGLQRPGERAHGHRARPGLRHQQPPLRHLHAARRHEQLRRASRASRSAPTTRSPRLRAGHLHLDGPARAVLPLRRLARLRAQRRPLHLHRRQHQPVRLRRLRRRSTSGPAASSGTPSAPPPTPTTTTARSCASTRCRARPARRASARPTRSPPGNMFAPGTANTLPEIFAMGFRNPFRITIDPHTGWVLLGNYGPDAGATNPNRGPQGSVEFEVVKGPGFYGWPYCVRDNVPYNDYDFANGTSGPKFDCANPVNNSPNNTGITNLPPAHPGHDVDGLHRDRPALPEPRHRRRADRRPALRLRPRPRQPGQVPRVLRPALVHRRVEQRLDQDRHARRPGQRHRRVRDAVAWTRSSGRTRWSSAPTARST